MKAIVKGLLVVAITIFLFAVTTRAYGGTPQEFLEIFKDKRVVYKGTCWFDKKSVLTFKTPEMKTSELCVVGFEIGNDKKHYVAIFDEKDQQAKKVISYDEKTKTQEILWMRGTGV